MIYIFLKNIIDRDCNKNRVYIDYIYCKIIYIVGNINL